MNRPLVRLALTLGEPAGIGPDLFLQLQRHKALLPDGCHLCVITDPVVLAARLAQADSACNLPIMEPGQHTKPGISLWPAARTRLDATPGHPDKANARYVLETLQAACTGCRHGHFDAMITGPVHKGIINDAGIRFSGHTEFLAQSCEAPRAVMLMVMERMKVALVTTHLPLKAVPAAIDHDDLVQVLQIIDHDMQRYFTTEARPRMAVLGLNPHAGEDGHLGTEEIEIIHPAIARARASGMDVIGPWSADTAFLPRRLQSVDVIVAMYHDQGLTVPKHAGFERTVNVTLGLPIIRTSVDHGVALDLAGSDTANPGSLKAALALAAGMARTSRSSQE